MQQLAAPASRGPWQSVQLKIRLWGLHAVSEPCLVYHVNHSSLSIAQECFHWPEKDERCGVWSEISCTL